MRGERRFLSIAFCIVWVNLLVGCQKPKEVVSGDFVYIPDGEKYATLCTLSQEGFQKQMKTVIVPPFIDGREVQAFGVTYYYSSSSFIHSDAMVEFYTPYTVGGFLIRTETSFAYGKALEKIVYVSNRLFENVNQLKITFHEDEPTYFVTDIGYHMIEKLDSSLFMYMKIEAANTAYMFNYENCPNDGYFFIDDYEYGSLIENTPYEPSREGYSFDGWYKEPECINVWNFETDTLPEEQRDEEDDIVYQETKLYAGWRAGSEANKTIETDRIK